MRNLCTPFGKFWLTADGSLVDFTLVDVTKTAIADMQKQDPAYNLEKAYILVPHLPENFIELTLQLCADFEVCSQEPIDVVSDEYFYGEMWAKENYVFAAAVRVDNGELDEYGTASEIELPSYYKVPAKFRDKLSFKLAYKQLDDFLTVEKSKFCDLSLDFAMNMTN